MRCLNKYAASTKFRDLRVAEEDEASGQWPVAVGNGKGSKFKVQ
jgi:hypothetical protein